MKPVVVDGNVTTAYGVGIDLLWDGLSRGHDAISEVTRFPVDHFPCQVAALVNGLCCHEDTSLIMQMLAPLLDTFTKTSMDDVFVILASTTGEIDLLERSVVDESADVADSRLQHLLKRVITLCGATSGMVMSAACASSTAAIAHAASLISAGVKKAVLVVACDCITEFVFSGFSTLRALAAERARPFDHHRDGLILGEGVGYMLLMDADEASRRDMPVMGRIAGWGLSNDANHMTGPSRDGKGLRHAISLALNHTHIAPCDIGAICAHGTGTVYNDGMEMKAFHSMFESPVPTFSIKGGTGHTMGAAGLIETMISLEVLKQREVLPTVGLKEVDPEAEGWVSQCSCELRQPLVLTTNSGFGGINAAIVVGGAESSQ